MLALNYVRDQTAQESGNTYNTIMNSISTTTGEITVISEVYCGDITADEAALKLNITIEEVNAMVDGFFSPQKTSDVPESHDSYSTPDLFERLFLNFIQLTNVSHLSRDLKSLLLAKLDEMTRSFPFETFPELYSTHFDWNETARILLSNESCVNSLDAIIPLRDEFWRIYSHRMRVIKEIANMRSSYYNELEAADKKIGDMRNAILEKQIVSSHTACK